MRTPENNLPLEPSIYTHMKRTTLRSIGAVVAGVLTIILVSTAVDILLHAVGIFPPVGEPMNDRLALLASSYRFVISIAGAYLTARLSPDRPLRHAMILGYVGTVFGLIGVIATWNLGLGPRWYPISLAVLAIPQCWLGGRLYELRRTSGRLA
jgi:hypothetical protein